MSGRGHKIYSPFFILDRLQGRSLTLARVYKIKHVLLKTRCCCAYIY